MKYLTKENIEILNKAKWVLAYTTVEEDIDQILSKIQVPIFGCSSFQGVFTPNGFLKGIHFLANLEDEIDAYAVLKDLKNKSLEENVKEALEEIQKNLKNIDILLLHSTMGYEEKILEIIDSLTNKRIPIYGGTPGDNDFTGKWFIFKNQQIVNDGFLLIGFHSNHNIYSAFTSGYIPTELKGIVTKAKGRIIYEINNQPAAIVYNEWLKGAIKNYIETGGVIVLDEVSLHPFGKIIDELLKTYYYVLIYPYSINKEDKSLYVLTELKEGDEIFLMQGNKQALIHRGKQVIEKALQYKNVKNILGAINIYCAGCIGVIMNDIQFLIQNYKMSLKNSPFIGPATFSEQGCFITKEKQNRQGNLMASSIIFALD